MSALVTFRDFDLRFDLWTRPPWYRVDWGKHNKMGYVTKTGMVTYPHGCGLSKTHIEVLKKRDHQLLPLPFVPEQENVDRFFIENRENADLFFQGMLAILSRRFSIFANPIKLPLLKPLSTTEYENRWQQFVELLQPADLILTLDTQSTLSKVIAAADHGVWSHVAGYVGGGQIIEAIAAGVVERSIDVYHTGFHRLGLYRPVGPGDVSKYISASRSQVGKERDGEFEYRVKSVNEPHERVVREGELSGVP
jgi:hypothetical protein